MTTNLPSLVILGYISLRYCTPSTHALSPGVDASLPLFCSSLQAHQYLAHDASWCSDEGEWAACDVIYRVLSFQQQDLGGSNLSSLEVEFIFFTILFGVDSFAMCILLTSSLEAAKKMHGEDGIFQYDLQSEPQLWADRIGRSWDKVVGDTNPLSLSLRSCEFLLVVAFFFFFGDYKTQAGLTSGQEYDCTSTIHSMLAWQPGKRQ